MPGKYSNSKSQVLKKVDFVNKNNKQSLKQVCSIPKFKFRKFSSEDISLMNLLAGCSKYSFFCVGNHKLQASFDFNNCSSFENKSIEIVILVDGLKHSLILSYFSVQKLLSILYHDINVISLSADIEKCLIQGFAMEIMNSVQMLLPFELQLISVNYLDNVNLNKHKIMIKLHISDNHNQDIGHIVVLQVAWSINKKSIEQIKQFLYQKLNNKRGSFYPNIPVIGRVIIGLTYLDPSKIDCYNNNSLQVNDIIVLKNKYKFANKMFCIIFNHLIYECKFINHNECMIINHNSTNNLNLSSVNLK